MNRVISAILIAASVATLAGCATTGKEYIVSTRNGRMEVATTRPQAVPGTDLLVYWDRAGNLQTIKRADFAQVMER